MKKIRCGVLAGSSSLAAEIRDLVRIVSRLDGPLLLMGERGGGKERVARLIHESSAAGSRSFEVFDCSLSFADELEHSLFDSGSLNRPGGGAVILPTAKRSLPVYRNASPNTSRLRRRFAGLPGDGREQG